MKTRAAVLELPARDLLQAVQHHLGARPAVVLDEGDDAVGAPLDAAVRLGEHRVRLADARCRAEVDPKLAACHGPIVLRESRPHRAEPAATLPNRTRGQKGHCGDLEAGLDGTLIRGEGWRAGGMGVVGLWVGALGWGPSDGALGWGRRVRVGRGGRTG